MKQSRRIAGAVILLVLFVMYRTSVTAFTHVHYVDGVPVAHSHPFQTTHSHSKTSLLSIGHLSAFTSFEADVYEVQHPMRPLLAVIGSDPATPALKGEALRSLSLRAPPVSVLSFS